jgi:glycosyltransferase involved in cell wall biosynthesis
MAKNIWIDGKEANVLQRLGSSQVAFELLKNIYDLDEKNNYTILLSDKPLGDLPKPRSNWKYKILKPGRLWTRIAVPVYYHLAKIKPDVIFSPTHYIPRFIKAKRVPVIFDLAFIHFPKMFKKDDLYKLTNWTKTSILESAHIITISESSKKDILETYKVPSDKVTVAYPGYDDQVFKVVKDQSKIDAILKKYQIMGEYIIYIGTVQPRKNTLRLIRAVKKIEGLKLVIAGKIKGKGKQGWMNEEILEEPKRLGIEERVIFTDFVPTEELPYLISGAKAFILPSLWEGFGIPVVEAMATGTPVITSNVSSLPEVVGDAGLLVNPESETQIEQAIRLLVTDKKLHNKLSKKALEQAKKFSWQKMAKEVIKVLEV